MCAPIPILLTAASGTISAFGQYQQGASAKKMYDYQAEVARQEGDIALRTGDLQSRLIQDNAKTKSKELATNQAEFNAAQQADAAGAGVSGGTLEDISNTTYSKEKLDEMALRYNADTQSWETTESAKNANWAAQSQANQYKVAGKNAKKAGTINAFGTLLGTAASIGSGGLLKGFSQGNVSGTGLFGSKFLGKTQSEILKSSTRAWS